jgi:16S rRNA (guanine527-N7)-methyltransferase
LDVGSGAGAPGLVLALLRPELPITLVEPKAKRVAFLRSAIGQLGLRRAVVEPVRSSALPAAGHDVAISRATFSPDDWLEEGARLARRTVWVLLARGQPPERAGFGLARELRYRWPLTGAERCAVELIRGAQPASPASPMP